MENDFTVDSTREVETRCCLEVLGLTLTVVVDAMAADAENMRLIIGHMMNIIVFVFAMKRTGGGDMSTRTH